MTIADRIDKAVRAALRGAVTGAAPRQLAEVLAYACLPGGARIRPTVLLSVATACGDDRPPLADAAAASLEFIHCASLIHDDLPCFDDADTRRGKPSVHRAFSEPLAVLGGDSLIVLAFETLARAAARDPVRGVELIATLAAHTGMPDGICAGQGWESEPVVDLSVYHRSKTAALFIAATQMGAISAGHAPGAWRDLGARIGEAFQIADDLRDVLMDGKTSGKPAGQDRLHGRPNAVAQLGVAGATRRLDDILAGAIASIPSCPGEVALARMVRTEAARMVPGAKSRATTRPT